MVTVKQAEHMIYSTVKDYGTEAVALHSACGRVLAEDLYADRDLPPCNRATMDGIAISYAAFEKGMQSFNIKAVLPAGAIPVPTASNECVEIMTGAALPDTVDTVVRYEDIAIDNGMATLSTDAIKKAQNIHHKGKDKKMGDKVAASGQIIDPALISMAASLGKYDISVQKLPSVVIISTGDELVDITDSPSPYQVRRSNSYTVQAALQPWHIHADLLHMPDEPDTTKDSLMHCLRKYDVIIMSGGVSMGRFDYIPQALSDLGVQKLFHKVQQRPGKPFWFGTHEKGCLVFAFPGNPVSTFMCLYRYFMPWLQRCLGLPGESSRYAVLDADVAFMPALQYFIQVRIHVNGQGQLTATPDEGNGSGDYVNLLDTNAFMELPLEKSNFRKGEIYRVWPFKQIL